MQCSNVFGEKQCSREASWNSNFCHVCDHLWNGHKDKLEDINFNSAKKFITKSYKLREDQRKSINGFTSYLTKKPIYKPTKSIVEPETPVESTHVHLHDIMTPSEVAEYFSISYMTLKRWTKAGKLKCIRINSRGDRRYLREEIERLMERL